MEEKNIEQDEITIDLWILLRDFIRGCIKFWWLILALMVAGGAIMFVTNIQTYTPMYQASATFTVTTNTTTDQNNQSDYNYYYDSSTAEQLSLTFPYILSSQILNDAIEADLGVEAINGSISASIIPNSNMITMTVISSDPDDAKEILESTIRVYPSVARFVIGMTKFNMIENPSVSNVPYNQPNYFNTVAKGALIGLAVGLVIVAIYAFFRKTVHKTQELEEVTNIKCLATVPYLKQKKRSRGKTIMPSILNLQTNPLFLENIESLHIRLAKELADINGKTLIFTSTVAKEGKSTIATNVAYALAKNNKKVLLIDADLRKQDLSKQMNLTTKGSSNVQIVQSQLRVQATVFGGSTETNGVYMYDSDGSQISNVIIYPNQTTSIKVGTPYMVQPNTAVSSGTKVYSLIKFTYNGEIIFSCGLNLTYA